MDRQPPFAIFVMTLVILLDFVPLELSILAGYANDHAEIIPFAIVVDSLD
jgi:hypothetical protein